MAKKFTIRLGNKKPITYNVIVTTAPRSYDGFGTFTIHEDYIQVNGKQARLVAIKEEHFNYQTGRYQSGMHTASDEMLDFMADENDEDVLQAIYERIIRGSLNEESHGR